MNKFPILHLLILVFTSLILAGSTNVQKSEPSKVDSQQIILLSQQISSLTKKIERFDSLFQMQTMQPISIPKKENWWKENAGWIKDWANVVFFAVAILGTGLTLLFNWKTLFNPLRTEVFKKKIEIYGDILRDIGKPNLCSYSDLIHLNIVSFLNQFNSYKGVIKNNNTFVNILNQRSINFKINTSTKSIKESVLKESYIKDNNGNYVISRIKVDNKTLTNLEKLRTFESNPFVTDEIKDLISKLIDSIKKNIKNDLSNVIEKSINNISSCDKDYETRPPNEQCEGTDDLIITMHWIGACQEYQSLGFNYKKEIAAVTDEISKQLKISETFIKQKNNLFKSVKSFRVSKRKN